MSEFNRPKRQHGRAALRAAMSASPSHRVAAERAANDFGKGPWAALRSEVRWAFTPPRIWLSGVVAIGSRMGRGPSGTRMAGVGRPAVFVGGTAGGSVVWFPLPIGVGPPLPG